MATMIAQNVCMLIITVILIGLFVGEILRKGDYSIGLIIYLAALFAYCSFLVWYSGYLWKLIKAVRAAEKASRRKLQEKAIVKGSEKPVNDDRGVEKSLNVV